MSLNTYQIINIIIGVFLIQGCNRKNRSSKVEQVVKVIKHTHGKITVQIRNEYIDFIQTEFSGNLYLMSTEVSNGMYQSVLGGEIVTPKDDPKVNISLRDAKVFCERLNELDANDIYTYRLPTKEEWLEACYDQGSYLYPWGNEKLLLNRDAKKQLQSIKSNPSEVTPNGIYNMWGNVSEWVNVSEDSIYVEFVGGNYKNEKPYKIRQESWGFVDGPDFISDRIGFRVLLQLKK